MKNFIDKTTMPVLIIGGAATALAGLNAFLPRFAVENIQQMEQNTMAARTFTDPITPGTREALGQIAGLTSAPMCPGCPSCNAWAEKTQYAFQDISRYVNYYESDGDTDARNYFRELSELERGLDGIDLTRVRDDCLYEVDYPEIARRSEIYFA